MQRCECCLLPFHVVVDAAVTAEENDGEEEEEEGTLLRVARNKNEAAMCTEGDIVDSNHYWRFHPHPQPPLMMMRELWWRL